MPFYTARPTEKRRRSNKNPSGPRTKGIYIPPPVTPGQKSESLDRRIRNIEALDNGIFIGNVLASYQALPGLVGFWPMSSVQRSTGNAYDLSGQGRTLTYNGNPSYTYYNGLVPYIDFDGTGDYLSRTDETDLDIIGNESVFTSGAAGLTTGMWVKPDTVAPGVAIVICGKSNNSTQKSWDVFLNTDGTITGRVSSDGSAVTQVISTALTSTDWVFITFRYTPSTELALFINNVQAVNTTSIPATIFNSTSALTVGAFSGGGNTFFGGVSFHYLCANALGDELISALYQQSRILFNV